MLWQHLGVTGQGEPQEGVLLKELWFSEAHSLPLLSDITLCDFHVTMTADAVPLERQQSNLTAKHHL